MSCRLKRRSLVQTRGKLFILNQNAEELFGYVWVEAAANISWQAVIGDAEATFANEPANYTVAPGSLVSVDITLARRTERGRRIGSSSKSG